MSREEFESAFDSRTLAYLPTFVADPRPVVIVVGEDAHTPIGHVLLVSLANQLARAHRRLVIVGDLDRVLLSRDLFGHGTIAAATLGLARAINPFIDATRADRIPTPNLVSLGVGTTDAEVTLGADGWRALIGDHVMLDSRAHAIWGALYASCLGAALAFHRQRGVVGDAAGRYSLWHPGSEVDGPTFAGPIDVGRVLQVGAGAVGAAVDYFVALIGLTGAWLIVDGDLVDASNLNRQVLYTARDAGFPLGEPVAKAARAAELLGNVARGHVGYYDANQEARNGRFDLVLALANERGVRRALQARQPTVLLHATTGPAWEAFLHRHIAGRDDCIDCRVPDETPAVFTCSEGAVRVGPKRMDAALPFLSATAGLVLVSALARLQQDALAYGRTNLWNVNLQEPQPWIKGWYRACRPGCTLRLPFAARSHIDRDSRFIGLDGAGLGETSSPVEPARR